MTLYQYMTLYESLIWFNFGPLILDMIWFVAWNIMICASPAVSLPNEDANEPILAVDGLRIRLPAHIHDFMQPK